MEPTDLPFGVWTWVGPRKHLLRGSPDTPTERDTFGAVILGHTFYCMRASVSGVMALLVLWIFD